MQCYPYVSVLQRGPDSCWRYICSLARFGEIDVLPLCPTGILGGTAYSMCLLEACSQLGWLRSLPAVAV